MFGYYLQLALRSFKRNKVLTVLMVLAIALGIGTSMTTLTVFKVLAGDPIPHKSDRLFYVQLDPQNIASYTSSSEPPMQLSRYDAEALLRQKRAPRQALMSGGSATVTTDGSGADPFSINTRHTSADFFAMFDVPFLYGQGWSTRDDDDRARVVVIDKELNDKLFGGGDSRGKTLQVDDNPMRIIGVVDDWSPNPHFFDLTTGAYGNREHLYLPFATAIDLKLTRRGGLDCYGAPTNDPTTLTAACAWVQYWVELQSPTEAMGFKAYLDNYSAEQKASGRYQRPPNTRLYDVNAWLQHKSVVPRDVRLQVWLALGFLLVCLVNTVSLLLAKFMRRSGEIGVRRALGASRKAIFAQTLVEAGSIGVVGGMLGLAVATLGLWLVRQQPTGYAGLAHLDTTMLLVTLVCAVAAALLAGIFPAWRAMQIAPAIQLKSQ